jgi:glucosamine kinase
MPVDVVGDMQIALEAAFHAGPGVIVIAGTGSIAYGRNRQGRTVRAGGWGFAIGDEGSAHWIGREAVRATLRASDKNEERMASSPLTAALLQAWGARSLLDLARTANSSPPPDFAALFPLVAASGEEIAHSVLARAGRELASLATIVLSRLFRDEKDWVRVGLAGGVFRYASEVGSYLYTELQEREPRVDVNLEVVDPVEGALSMARRAAKGV